MSPINLIVAIRKAFPEWHRQQAYDDLMALDDHTLADIGLRRADIVAGHYQETQARNATAEWQTAPRPRPALADRHSPPS